MMRPFRDAMQAVALTLLLCRLAAAEIVLVDGGKARATIVIAQRPGEQAKQAAQILRDHIERISGARLEIKSEKGPVSGARILVGCSQAVRELGIDVPSGFTHQMNEEGFVIRTVGKDLVLAGNEDWHYRGTVFAVYDLLEQLGCRWFFPGAYGQVLPKRDRIVVGQVDRRERPSFRFRNLWYSGWMPADQEDQQNLRTWYDRNKMTALSISLPGDGSITRLAPAKRYFKSHPQIFALDKNGKRVENMLCLAEPETVRIAVSTIKETFRKDPDAISFGFAPPDGFPMCHCERCQADIPGFTGKGYGDPSLSDSWFRFANKVAEEVYKAFPNRWLFTNGYANRVRLPESIERFSPNLGIQSAMIAACTLHRIGDSKCWQRTLYKQLLDRWTEKLNCVFIYDYDPGNSLVNLPFPMLHNLKHDVPYFKARGVWGFWTEGQNAWMVTHLNYYVRAKLMWNAQADVDELVRDYCQRFYGKAADAVERYVWTLEEVIDQTTVHETWGRLMPWRVVLPPVMKKLDACMQEAGRLAERPESQLHVRVLQLVHDHMKAYLAMEQAVARGEFAKGVEWADRMLAIRDRVGKIGPGLLPHTSKWARRSKTSLEWHKTVYQGLADRAGGRKGKMVLLLPRRWAFKTDPKDIGVIYRWYLPETSEGWDTIDTTLYCQAQGHHDEHGWVTWGKIWYRTGFDVPADVKGKRLWLTIGGVYNRGVWIWVNGVLQRFKVARHWRLGHHDVRTPIDIDVTERIRPGQVNHVAVLVSTPSSGRNPRSGIHRRSFLWTPK